MSLSRTSCAFCKENGHHIKNCSTLANIRCGNCNCKGHTTNHCEKPKVPYRPPRHNGPRTPIKKSPTVNNLSLLPWGKVVETTVAPWAPKKAPPAVMNWRPTAAQLQWGGFENEDIFNEKRAKMLGWADHATFMLKVGQRESDDAKIYEALAVVPEAKIKFPMIKRVIPRGVRWADIADEDSDSE